MMPNVKPIKSENTNAVPTSSNVAGMRSKIAVTTGSDCDVE